jgi:hypothetical protein
MLQLTNSSEGEEYAANDRTTRPDRFKHSDPAALPQAIPCHILCVPRNARQAAVALSWGRFVMLKNAQLDQLDRACVQQSCHGNFRRRIVFWNWASWQRSGRLQCSYNLCAESYFLVRYMAKVSLNFLYIGLGRWRIGHLPTQSWPSKPFPCILTARGRTSVSLKKPI